MTIQEFKTKVKNILDPKHQDFKNIDDAVNILKVVNRVPKPHEKSWEKIKDVLASCLTDPNTYAVFTKKHETEKKIQNLEEARRKESEFKFDDIQIDENYPSDYPEILQTALKDAAKKVIYKAHLSNLLKHRFPSPQPERIQEIKDLSDTINLIYKIHQKFNKNNNLLDEASEKLLMKMYVNDTATQTDIHKNYQRLSMERKRLIAQCKNPKSVTQAKRIRLAEVRNAIDDMNIVTGRTTTPAINHQVDEILKGIK